MSYAPERIGALEWCVRPQLDLPRFWSRARTRLPMRTELDRPPRLRGAEVMGGLVLWGTENQRRTFAPLEEVGNYREVTLGAEKWDWARVMLDPVSRMRLERVGRKLLRNERLEDLGDTWNFTLRHTAYFLRVARRIGLSRYKFVAVSSQHAPYLRAFLWEAARAGVPTVYVPHAPVADNALYLDLPTSVAGLRGPAEVELYERELGTGPNELVVVGNPASDVLADPMPTIPPGARGVLALSPQPLETIKRIVRMVEAGSDAPLRVAPHPRSDVDSLRKMVPETWTIEEGRRTLDVLREGPSFLLQHSSGVAWEAAALGIPTAEISLDGAAPNYHFLKDDSVFPSLDSPDAVAAFIGASGVPPGRREEIRAYARRWCSSDGAEARTALLELFGGADAWPSSMIYDGWGIPSSVTLEKSRVL